MTENELDQLAAALPVELRATVSAVGLDKVAQHVLGLDARDEHATYARIGAELFRRRKEAAIVSHGLGAMRSLESSR